MINIKKEIELLIEEAVKKTYPDLNLNLIHLQKTDKQFGDYQSNIAFLISKILKEKYDGR